MPSGSLSLNSISSLSRALRMETEKLSEGIQSLHGSVRLRSEAGFSR